MKTPNNIRSARNRAADAARYIARISEQAMERERFAAEHANDCWCDLCQCFGQGTCEAAKDLDPEAYAELCMAI